MHVQDLPEAAGKEREMERIKVEGNNRNHQILVYALSTCGWCRKTKNFLNDHDLEYEYIDVDKCSAEDRETIKNDIKSRVQNPGFPTIIVDGEKVISGFKESVLEEELGL